MSTQTVSLKDIPNPQIRDLLLALRQEIFADLNCCLPGTIQSFDATKQSAVIQVNMKRQVSDETPSFPPLVDVPVLCLGGGTANLTFPIKTGDTCLIIFSDRNIDSWWTTGSTGSAPATPRMHSLSDAFAIVGLRSLAGALTGLSATDAMLRNGTTGIKVGTGQLALYNATTDIRTMLDLIFSALLTWTNTGGSTPNAATVININTAKTAADALFKTP